MLWMVEHACRVGKRREHTVPRLQKYGRHRRHPVVHVGDVRDEAGVLANLQRRLAQHAEAVAVLAPAVEIAPAEIALVIDEPDRHFAIEFPFENTDPDFLALAKMDATGARKSDAVALAIDESIKRHDDADIVATFAQRFGQTRHCVAESAALRERRAFGRNEKNPLRRRSRPRREWGLGATAGRAFLLRLGRRLRGEVQFHGGFCRSFRSRRFFPGRE